MKSTLELHVSVLVELQIPEISFVKPINAMLWTMFGSGVGVFSYALFDTEGHQVPQALVIEVGEVFETLLEEVTFIICSHGFMYLLISGKCGFL